MKKFLVVAVFFFPCFGFAQSKCDNLQTAVDTVKADKQELKGAQEMLAASITAPRGSIEKFTESVVQSYQICQKHLLEWFNLGPHDRAKAILTQIPDADAAARCYNAVTQSYNGKMSADDFCISNDTDTGKKNAAKLAGYFGSGKGGLLTTNANFYHCKDALKDAVNASNKLVKDQANYNKTKDTCKDEKLQLMQEDSGDAPASGTP